MSIYYIEFREVDLARIVTLNMPYHALNVSLFELAGIFFQLVFIVKTDGANNPLPVDSTLHLRTTLLFADFDEHELLVEPGCADFDLVIIFFIVKGLEYTALGKSIEKDGAIENRSLLMLRRFSLACTSKSTSEGALFVTSELVE